MVPPPFRLPIIIPNPYICLYKGQQKSKAQKPQNEQTSNQRHKFTPEEDKKLRQLVNEGGENNWAEIAMLVGTKRSARQCRERYRNYLSPKISNTPWSDVENDKLRALYKIHGPKWAMLSSFFENRSDVNIKNHWLQLNSNRNSREQNLQIEKQKLLEQIDLVISLNQAKMKTVSTENLCKKQKNEHYERNPIGLLNFVESKDSNLPMVINMKHDCNDNNNNNNNSNDCNDNNINNNNNNADTGNYFDHFGCGEGKDSTGVDWYGLNDVEQFSKDFEFDAFSFTF